MDWDTCNHKKLSQFQKEAQRWKSKTDKGAPKAPKKGLPSQPSKRKRKR